MSRTSKNIINQRVKEVSEMLVKGHNRDFILQNTSNLWNISDRQIDTYISKGRELIEKSIKRKIEYDYAKAVRRYEDLYKLSLEKKDYKTALAVNKELTTLQGLFKQNIEHSGSIEFICNIPD